MNTLLSATHDPRWADLVARNGDADGRYVYSVKTTGVYCRPSCASRLPRPENVRFHASPAAAERAGFRPCKRCHPDAAVQSPIRFAMTACSLGTVLVATRSHGICAILLGDDADALMRELRNRWPRAQLVADAGGLADAVAEVAAFVESPGRGLQQQALDLDGTDFQRRVWRALQRDPAGQHRQLRRDRATHRFAHGGSRRCRRLCGQHAGSRGAVPSRGPQRWRAFRLSLGHCAQARAAAARGARMSAARCGCARTTGAGATRRLAGLGRHRPRPRRARQRSCSLACSMNGNAGPSPLCTSAMNGFRNRVVMARHGFGRGEYRYFAYPLPAPVATLRAALYPHLAPIANRWNEAHGHRRALSRRARRVHRTLPRRRARRGRRRCCCATTAATTTACTRTSTANTCSRCSWRCCCRSRQRDFDGGEFVLTEQRPRMQSRAEVVPLRQGDAVVFAVHQRPVQGRARHLSRAAAPRRQPGAFGRRHTLGVIFHDAH